MNSTTTTTARVYTVEQSPSNRRNWFVIDPEQHVVGEPFASKKAAQTEADSLTADAAFEDSAKTPEAPMPSQAEADAVSGLVQIDASKLTPEQLASMPYDAIMDLARPERDLMKAWMAGGSKGKRPGTPVLDWTLNLDLVCKPAKAPRVARTPGVAQSRTPEQQERFVAILTEAKAAGGKWHQAAKKLTEEGIPTSKGGGWYYSTVQGLAKSMGLI